MVLIGSNFSLEGLNLQFLLCEFLMYCIAFFCFNVFFYCYVIFRCQRHCLTRNLRHIVSGVRQHGGLHVVEQMTPPSKGLADGMWLNSIFFMGFVLTLIKKGLERPTTIQKLLNISKKPFSIFLMLQEV